MEKEPETLLLERCAMASVALALGFTSVSCCIAAELKKAEEEDMKIDGRLCFLARTPAFGFGIAAIAFLTVAQIIGTSLIRTSCWPSSGAKVGILFISWMSFVMASILLATGSSMNDWQHYGKGWLHGSCYTVRTGVFTASAALVVVNLVLMLVIVTKGILNLLSPALKSAHNNAS